MKKSKPHQRPLYLMYEIEARELRARFFAATKLAASVSRVVIFQHSELYRIALFSKPGDVLIKSSSYTFITALRLMKIRGFQVFQHQEEGIHFHADSEVPLTMSPSVNRQCSFYFAWHEYDARVAQLGGFERNQVAIVGNMRFEYLRNLKVQRKLNESSKLRVLVLTNFDFTNLIYRNPKRGTQDELAGVSKVLDVVAQQQRVGVLNRELYLQFLGDKRIDDFEITIRKYFFETKTIENEKMKFATDTNLNFYDSLDTADLILHYGSTGGLEGVFLGLPSIILTSDPSSLIPAISGISSIYTDLDDLFEELYKFDRDRLKLSMLSSIQREHSKDTYGFDLEESFQIKKLIELLDDKVQFRFRLGLRDPIILLNALRVFFKSRIRLSFNFIAKVKSVEKASKLTQESVDMHLRILDSKGKFDYKIHRSKRIVDLRLNSNGLRCESQVERVIDE